MDQGSPSGWAENVCFNISSYGPRTVTVPRLADSCHKQPHLLQVVLDNYYHFSMKNIEDTVIWNEQISFFCYVSSNGILLLAMENLEQDISPSMDLS